jgi:transformation/transcription domain-associated protein
VREHIFSHWMAGLTHQNGNDVVARVVNAICKENWMPLKDTPWYQNVVLVFLRSLDGKQDSALKLMPAVSSRFSISMSVGASFAAPSVAKKAKKNIDVDSFVEEARRVSTVNSVTQPLASLLWHVPKLARALFVWLVPEMWALSSDGQRLSLALQSNKVFETLLKQPSQHRPPFGNAVEAMLMGLSQCEPVPLLDTKLFAGVAHQFAAWMPCETLLHRYMKLNKVVQEDAIVCLSKLYELMHLPRLSIEALRLRQNQSPLLVTAIPQLLAGKWDEASNTLLQAMQQLSEKDGDTSESKIVEDLWVECAKRLESWPLLRDFCKASGNTELMLESAWKCNDWQALQVCVNAASSKTATVHLASAMCQIIDMDATSAAPVSGLSSNRPEVTLKSSLSDAISLGLRDWAGLPRGVRVTNSQLELVHFFHRVVEVQESAALVREASSTKRRPTTAAEIRNRLSSWRDRMPSVWDDSLHWSNVLVWRHHVFGVLNRNLGLGMGLSTSSGVGVVTAANMSSAIGTEIDPAVTSNLGFHELAWSLCAYARASRKQMMMHNALESLGRVYQLPNVQLDDAFLKLKNQIKCYIKMPQLYNDGMSVINGTSTEYFSQEQRAEWNVLAGQLHAAQAWQPGVSTEHFAEQANRAFATASADVKSMSKCWIHWGHLYDRRQTQCSEEERQTRGDYMFSCYLRAVVIDPVRAHRLFSRLLVHLAYEDNNGANQITWEKYQASIPAWLLFDHLPQLIFSFLSNPTSALWQQCLVLAASANPLAVFQTLRAYSIALSECRKTTQLPAAVAGNLTTVISALEQILQSLQTKSEVQASEKVFSCLERALVPAKDDVGVLCDELFRVLRGLETEQLQRNGPNCAVPAAAKATLARLAESHPNEVGELGKFASAKTTKAGVLHGKVQAVMNAAASRRSLADAELAKKVSKALIDTLEYPFDLEAVGMQNELGEDVWNNTSTTRFTSKVDVVNGNLFLHLCSSTGVVRRFLVRRFASAMEGLREDLMWQLRRSVNEFLVRHEATARLQLHFSVPFRVVVGNRVLLVECPDVSSISQWQVLEQHWQKNGVNPTQLFQTMLAGEPTSQLVPENVLSEYVSKRALFGNPGALFCFKEWFTKELSLQCSISHLLRIPDAQLGPEHFHIRSPSGSIFQSNLFSEYVQDGSKISLAPEEPPQRHMRLTPTIRNLIGPVHQFSVATQFHAFQRAIADSQVQMRSCLELFARDDLYCWGLEEGCDVNSSSRPLVTAKIAAALNEAALLRDDSPAVLALLSSDATSSKMAFLPML